MGGCTQVNTASVRNDDRCSGVDVAFEDADG